jgi:DNA-binding CsgD family transcriptional regulator
VVTRSKAKRWPSRQAALADDAPALFTPEEWLSVARLLRLSPRQRAVAELLCAECSQREMAERLGLSLDTIRAHLRALYARLRVRSRVGVVVCLVLAQRELSGARPTVSLLFADRTAGGPAGAEEAPAVKSGTFP